MEHFVPQIQVDTYAQMHTRVKLLGECRFKSYSNYWGKYSQIIGAPILTGFQHPCSCQYNAHYRSGAQAEFW